ncbi:MAG: CDP-alcohol phosphatidyltransferase family protein [Rhizobiales bacterium]|nr:CDP-alcohol phosphatidyltransferase family protein [Hyphomicrobiales bacterium]MBO6699290.1 CDP-alcohol phosphatidyltransferase family protein [Hyphomicrobiales bacterium]MBO6736828.1 CDP-alcohol phosphatidyltransferase family protein [Hyphomicrobiales bacterium]MBO6912098.1 CDP-alcohol phosphatidyltransferase family protein [Hyphomicrobiales bacterium]MBO6954534.1 CDP-alcohol phosphatidyltransferase family protein [Hyphomicrobiales bacterium]
MLDGQMRTLIDPPLNALGRGLARSGLTADHITLIGLVLGLAAGLAIAFQAYWIGLGLVLASRLADGLDGAVARATQKTDRGGYLDIVCDYAFYAAIPLGFAIADPSANAVAACAMLFSFYINGGSFLGYAILAEKHGLSTDRRGSKSLYFTGGLAEGTETIAVFVVACLAPAWFPWLAYGFTVLVMLTAIARILMAWQTFKP